MRYFKRFLSLALVVLFASLPVVVYAQRQDIIDWWRLRDYVPTQAVAALATDTTMTEYGKKLFYVSNPQIDQISDFQQHCTDSEKTQVLGCYTNEPKIYIYDVTDQRLKGVEEVTAAHEMLHAAYDRLGGKERTRIDDLTAAVYKNLKDERIRKNVEQYRSRDESVVPNELHSILATEVRGLPAELEQYYSQYFSNRLKIVALSEQYEQEFTSRNDKIDEYDKKLDSLKKRIELLEVSLDSQLKVLQTERQMLEQLLAQNQREQYNQSVPGFNAKVSAYNNSAKELKSLVNEYNQLVEVRNDLASEIRDLTKALDTRVDAEVIEQ